MFISDIDEYKEITTDEPIICGDIGDYAKITCKDGVIISGDIGNYVQINCTGTPTISGDIGNYVKINCRGTPRITGQVGHNLEVNGRAYSASSSSPSDSSVSLGVDRTLALHLLGSVYNRRFNFHGPVNVSVYHSSFDSDTDSDSESDINRNEVKEVSRSSERKEYQPVVKKKPEFPTDVKEDHLQKLTEEEEKYLKGCSADVQLYINSLVRQPELAKKNLSKKDYNIRPSIIVEQLNLLSEEEEKLLKKFHDPLTDEIMDKPVRVNRKVLDFKNVLKLKRVDKDTYEDPFSKLKFTPQNIGSCDLPEEFEKIIMEIKEARMKKAAEKEEEKPVAMDTDENAKSNKRKFQMFAGKTKPAQSGKQESHEDPRPAKRGRHR